MILIETELLKFLIKVVQLSQVVLYAKIGFPYFFSPSPTDINADGIKCPTLIIGAGR